MWKRDARDQLLRALLDMYGLNLLAMPREKVAVGDVYEFDGERASTTGNIVNFCDPPLELLDVTAGETMADLIGKVCNSVSIKQGLGFLDGFLTAMGLAGILTKVHMSYEAKGTKELKFHFVQPTRDSIDVWRLGSMLIKHRPIIDNPAYNDRSRYFVASAVARSPSISVIAERNDGNAVDVNLGVIKVIDAATGASVTKSNQGEVTFKGKRSLAFGVELRELSYDAERGLRLLLPPGAIKVAGFRDERGPLLKPAFLGDPTGSAFIHFD